MSSVAKTMDELHANNISECLVIDGAYHELARVLRTVGVTGTSALIDFMEVVVQLTESGADSLIYALSYLTRMVKKHPKLRVGRRDAGYRLFLTALNLAWKMSYDEPYFNCTWAKVALRTGLEFRLCDISAMETEMLALLDFNCSLSSTDYAAYHALCLGGVEGPRGNIVPLSRVYGEVSSPLAVSVSAGAIASEDVAVRATTAPNRRPNPTPTTTAASTTATTTATTAPATTESPETKSPKAVKVVIITEAEPSWVSTAAPTTGGATGSSCTRLDSSKLAAIDRRDLHNNSSGSNSNSHSNCKRSGSGNMLYSCDAASVESFDSDREPCGAGPAAAAAGAGGGSATVATFVAGVLWPLAYRSRAVAR